MEYIMFFLDANIHRKNIVWSSNNLQFIRR